LEMAQSFSAESASHIEKIYYLSKMP